MKVKIINKNIFRDGQLWRVGSEMPLEKESDFSEKFMEWVEKPKAKKVTKKKKTSKPKTDKETKPLEVVHIEGEAEE